MLMNYTPTPEELLALEIANALGDEVNLSQYKQYAQKHPEPFLRQILQEVLAYPVAKIRKSRGALFSYLVFKYGRKHNHSRS